MLKSLEGAESAMSPGDGYIVVPVAYDSRIITSIYQCAGPSLDVTQKGTVSMVKSLSCRHVSIVDSP